MVTRVSPNLPKRLMEGSDRVNTIEQIPATIYAVSLARTRRIVTTAGTFSVHHMAPQLFGGFDETGGVHLATAEKALFDLAYLAPGRSRFFAGLPELHVPLSFRWAELKRWRDCIPAEARRAMAAQRLQNFIEHADVVGRVPIGLRAGSTVAR